MWNNITYPTVKHAFQAAKYLLASNRPDVATEFSEGGSLGPDPVVAKRAGSRKGMHTRGACLDIALWNRLSDGVMRELITIKKQHPVIQGILEICHIHRIPLFHFSLVGYEMGLSCNTGRYTEKRGEPVGTHL